MKPIPPFLGGGGKAGLGGPDAPCLAGADAPVWPARRFLAMPPMRDFQRMMMLGLGGGLGAESFSQSPASEQYDHTAPSTTGFAALPAHTDNRNTYALTTPMRRKATPTRPSGWG